ncbi:hypothetical protein [Acinetobacter sp. MB5]|uniref:hypothetical protein n=1 Tax=Acinetobacter sp. MB5 TaxID=2069438 RepID=UPI000DCF6BF8|nr:hypothetical protein [Acinetobacter sp. MB5]
MKTNKSNFLLLWILVGILLAICLGVFVWQTWFVGSQPSQTPKTVEHKTQAPPMAKPIASEPETFVSEPTVAASETQSTSNQAPKQLVNSDVIKQPVPQNPSLAKEEVSKLEDIQKQLKQQESTLKAQHADADKLIQLKQEQIKLLEQQLAEQQK